MATTTKIQCPHCEAMLKPKYFNNHMVSHGSSYRND